MGFLLGFVGLLVPGRDVVAVLRAVALIPQVSKVLFVRAKSQAHRR